MNNWRSQQSPGKTQMNLKMKLIRLFSLSSCTRKTFQIDLPGVNMSRNSPGDQIWLLRCKYRTSSIGRRWTFSSTENSQLLNLITNSKLDYLTRISLMKQRRITWCLRYLSVRES